MATTDGPIEKMLSFMRRKESRAVVQPEDINEDGFIKSKKYDDFKSTRDEGDKNKPIAQKQIKVPKRLKGKEVKIKYKKTKSDPEGEYNDYKAKKMR